MYFYRTKVGDFGSRVRVDKAGVGAKLFDSISFFIEVLVFSILFLLLYQVNRVSENLFVDISRFLDR